MRQIFIAIAFTFLLCTNEASGTDNFCIDLKRIIQDSSNRFPSKGDLSPPLDGFPNDPGEKEYECGAEAFRQDGMDGRVRSRCQISINTDYEGERYDQILMGWSSVDFNSAKRDAATLARSIEGCIGIAPVSRVLNSEHLGLNHAWEWNVWGSEVRVRANQQTMRSGNLRVGFTFIVKHPH